MNDEVDPLRILFDKRALLAPNVPEDLLAKIFQMESEIQFDSERTEAVSKIKRAIGMYLDRESLKGSADGYAL